MKKVIFNKLVSWVVALPVLTSVAEMQVIDDAMLDEVSGQAGLTINARIKVGDEADSKFSSFTYENTSGKAKTEASVADTSYFIVDKLSGAIEMKGLQLDLISDLNKSGKSALQWTLPKEIKAENFKTAGIYAASAKEETPGGEIVPDNDSRTFLLGVELNGTLTLPAETKISVFVVN